MDEVIGGLGAVFYLVAGVVVLAIAIAPVFIWRHAAAINRKMDKLDTSLTHLSVEIRKLGQVKKVQ